MGIVFPTFMMARASDQLLPTSLFYHRGDLGRGRVGCFSLYYLTFLWQRPTCSKVKVVCFVPLEIADLWLHKPFFKMSLLHDVSHQERY